jgi:hypothetical protein
VSREPDRPAVKRFSSTSALIKLSGVIIEW